MVRGAMKHVREATQVIIHFLGGFAFRSITAIILRLAPFFENLLPSRTGN